MNTIQGEKELTTDDEPYKECRQCGTCFPMSKLSKHVMECVGEVSTSHAFNGIFGWF